uniref:Uncharacterized protein n=1 Tax=Anguilla anguilla TaxID=7936 RepID=A0A0E9VRI9_ANGAN
MWRSHFQELTWLPVEARVAQLRLNMVHKIVNHRPPNILATIFLVLRNHTATEPDLA